MDVQSFLQAQIYVWHFVKNLKLTCVGLFHLPNSPSF